MRVDCNAEMIDDSTKENDLNNTDNKRKRCEDDRRAEIVERRRRFKGCCVFLCSNEG